MLKQLQIERSRKQTVVAKKMDAVVQAKLEADRKYEAQRRELEGLKNQISLKDKLDQAKKKQLENAEAKMKRDMDQAVATFTSDMATLKKENEQMQKQFE